MAEPSGSRKVAVRVARLTPPGEMLASSQITAPAGAAVTMARHRTNRVRSISDVYRMRATAGRRYGGSSSVNAEASPRRTVRDNTHDTTSVNITPTSTIATTEPAATSDATAGEKDAATNTVASMINVGKRPLQGTKLLVRMATSRSRGESITRVAITPAALQPKPIAIDSACLPCAPARLKR